MSFIKLGHPRGTPFLHINECFVHFWSGYGVFGVPDHPLHSKNKLHPKQYPKK